MSILLAEAYLHQLDPFAMEFPTSWQNLSWVPQGIRWYGLSYMAGFILAWLLFRWMAVTKRSTLPTASAAADLLFYIILGVLVGGRLGYVLFYQPSLLVEFQSSFPFWGLLAVNTGGMASHGGMIGVMVACWLFARRYKLSPLHLCDLSVLAAPVGLGAGRLANFINAELWGKALPASRQSFPPSDPPIEQPWWSVKYPEEILIWDPAVEMDLARRLQVDQLDSVVAGGTSFYQNVVDAAKEGDQTVIAVVEPLLTAYYPSQIIQAMTDGPVVLAILVLLWLRPRKPGVIGGVFFIAYGGLRIFTELLRQPDEGVGLLFGMLSRGQVLSILMVIAGIAVVILCQRRNVERIGGLLRPSAES